MFRLQAQQPLSLSLSPYRVHHPVDFPGWCEVRVDTLTCKMTLVQSADPRLPCRPGNGHYQDPSHGSLEHYLQLAE